MSLGPTTQPTSTRHRRRFTRKTVGLVAALTVSVGLAACSAGTAGDGGSGGSGASGQSAKYLNFFPCCSWGTTWSNNPYNVNTIGFQTGMLNMPLAIHNYPSLTENTPQLSDKWTSADGKLVVHLREDAKWEDGTPVTSKDLYDTVILNGTRGDGFWNDISDVEATDDHTVTFTLNKGQPAALAEYDILGIVAYPSSVYGKFVTDGLASDVKTYYRATQKNPDKAAKSGEFKRMGEAFKDLAGAKVDKLISDGPFVLNNITTKEAKLDKSPTFWAADKIKIGGIDYSNGSNQAAYPQMLSGNTDFSTVYMPPPIAKQWSTVQDSHSALPLSFGFTIGFNSSRYPLNMKEVRQALAYVIPRQQITESAYGPTKAGGGSWKEINTGISPAMEKLYMTSDQLNQLNKYPVDPDKATSLLKSKGFTKNGDQWMMPNGKPFKMTFTVNADTSDIVTSFTSAAKALSAFGIKSDVNATSGAQQDADQHNGNFDAGMYFLGGSNPLGVYSAIMGPGQNYSDSGTYSGKRGIGFGPKMDVPGLGNVNVPETLEKQATGVAPGPKMKEDVWDWARLVNDQVPYIWYATKVYQFSYSTKNFDNWPPTGANGSSQLWDMTGDNFNLGLSLALQQGYINPKS